MRLSLIRVVVSIVTLIFSSVSLHAQTQASAKLKPAGSVSGRITIKGKGAPGIAVAVRKSEIINPNEMMRAVTDQDGNYKITNVVPGSWEVVPSTLAYVVVNADNPGRRSVVIGDGENIENINFALVKGGVITGKITDSDGRPVIQTQVRLYKVPPAPSRPTQQPPPIYPSSSLTTDDRGLYRFFGLTAGKYMVAVGRTSQGFNMPGRLAYKEVFYPDAPDSAKATAIEVSEGSEATGIDMTMGRPMETFSVSGRAVDGEKGEPLPGFRFFLQRLLADEAESMNPLVVTNSSGEFTVENLLPGKYVVFLFPEANSEMRAENTPFEIIDSDVTGVTIRLVKGSSISGVVVLETDDKKAAANLGKMQVQAYVQSPTGGMSYGSSARATIGPDGSFRLGGLAPGMASLLLSPTTPDNQLRSFSISRLERDGVVVPPRGFEVKDGEQITGVRMVVVYGNASLRGVVNIVNGPLPVGARIIVRLMKPGDVPINMRPPTVDERGHFVADGIPPGPCELWVMINGVRKPPVKQSIVLQDGGVTDITIIVDLADTKP
jgi:hypothetical protein